MTTAISEPTTRRAALRGTIATVIASMTAAPAIAASTRSLTDARLIALCGQLDALQDDFDELFSRRTTIAEEEQTEHEMDALYARKDALMTQLEEAVEADGPPTTMRGIVAVARAGLLMHPHRDTDGTTIASDDGEWLLLMCAEALTGNG